MKLHLYIPAHTLVAISGVARIWCDRGHKTIRVILQDIGNYKELNVRVCAAHTV